MVLLLPKYAFSPTELNAIISSIFFLSAFNPGAPLNRRAALGAAAAAVLGTAFPAKAMIVPGLNSPGLVKATPVRRKSKPDFAKEIRDVKTNHFWNPEGIQNSVPRQRGGGYKGFAREIITPVSPVKGFGGGYVGYDSDYYKPATGYDASIKKSLVKGPFEIPRPAALDK